jgi:hypothetical protein
VTERPLFIDPITVGSGEDVDDAPAPRWFVVAALVLLTVAGYYLGSFLNGPRDSSPHNYRNGAEVYERVTAP